MKEDGDEAITRKRKKERKKERRETRMKMTGMRRGVLRKSTNEEKHKMRRG